MAKKKEKPVVMVDEVLAIEQFVEYQLDTEQQPQTIDALRHDYDLGPVNVKLETLIDKTFDLIAFRKMESNIVDQEYYYFTLCHDFTDDEMFTVSMGCNQLMELLDRIEEQGIISPVRITLRFLKQGKYGGYYVPE